ncbi:MAG TPA: hypothetical protein VF453_12600 [Burkholderiaceae bacterium]
MRPSLIAIVVSVAELLAGAIPFALFAWINAMFAVLNLFTYKPTPYVQTTYMAVYLAAAFAEIAVFAKWRTGSVVVPAVPLVYGMVAGVFSRAG